MLDLALGWLASHDFVPSVIAGATSAAQIEANAAGAQWRLTPEEVEEVAELTKVEKD